MFGAINYTARIENLGLSGYEICGTSIGAFASNNYGTIINCYANGTLKVSNFADSIAISVGGIVAYNQNGLIENCYVAGKIQIEASKGSLWIGAIASSNRSTIKNSLFLGKIELNLLKYNNEMQVSIEPISICSYNNGTTLNNYISNTSNISINKEDEGATSPPFDKNDLFIKANEIELNSINFYKTNLSWNTEIWDLAQLNIFQNKYPKLKNL